MERQVTEDDFDHGSYEKVWTPETEAGQIALE